MFRALATVSVEMGSLCQKSFQMLYLIEGVLNPIRTVSAQPRDGVKKFLGAKVNSCGAVHDEDHRASFLEFSIPDHRL